MFFPMCDLPEILVFTRLANDGEEVANNKCTLFTMTTAFAKTLFRKGLGA
jgi:hypothetical protein